MKKLFSFAAALLACAGLCAEDVTFTMGSIFDGNEQSYTVTEPVDATVSTTSSKSNAKDSKLGSDGNYFQIVLESETFSAAGLNGYINTTNTEKNWGFQFSTDGGATWQEELYQANDGDKTAHDIIIGVEVPDGANGIRIIRCAGTSTYVYSVTLTLGAGSTDPVLKANPEEVTLAASAFQPSDEAKVTFSGKNLTAGIYALTVPNVAGLSIAPQSVTVGEDGKLSEEITLTYAPAEEASGNTSLSLTIGELTQTVAVAYSANFAKQYLAFSLNIEQWVLDNGKRDNDFHMSLGNAGWTYENINDLDSLNDAKTARNEPYLGLKLKTAGAYLAGWMKADDVLNIKFGYVADNVRINGVEIDKTTLADPFQITVTEDTYVKIETTTKNTVVLKQLMLNEPIAPVTLPGEQEGISNTDATVKTMKVLRNGVLLIEQNGTRYNMQGAELR